MRTKIIIMTTTILTSTIIFPSLLNKCQLFKSKITFFNNLPHQLLTYTMICHLDRQLNRSYKYLKNNNNNKNRNSRNAY